MYKIGDPVIYSMPKVSTRPGQRAQDVHACALGESYDYIVEKFWRVADIIDDNQIEIVTRRGKTRLIRTDDLRLRKAGTLNRLFYRKRFPVLDEVIRSAA